MPCALRAGEGHRVLGDERFLEAVFRRPDDTRSRLWQMDEIVAVVCRSYGIGEGELSAPGRGRELAEARAVAAHVATMAGEVSVTQVARRFGRDVVTLSTGMRWHAATVHAFTAGCALTAGQGGAEDVRRRRVILPGHRKDS